MSTTTPPPQADRTDAGRHGQALPVTDGEFLLLFSQQKQQQAFEQLVHRHAALVWSACRQVLSQQQDVEDAFQATFLILARRAGDIRASDSVAGWLYRVAHRTSLALWRKNKRDRAEELDGQQVVGEEIDPLERLQHQHETKVLTEELQALPSRYREPLVLFHLEGLSQAEAADMLDISPATVKGRLARGRRLLRGRLARRGVALSVAAGFAASAVESSAAAVAATPLVATTATAASKAGAASTAVTTSATVNTLVQQGVSTMHFASLVKPAACLLLLAAVGVGMALASVPNEPNDPVVVLDTNTDEPQPEEQTDSEGVAMPTESEDASDNAVGTAESSDDETSQPAVDPYREGFRLIEEERERAFAADPLMRQMMAQQMAATPTAPREPAKAEGKLRIRVNSADDGEAIDTYRVELHRPSISPLEDFGGPPNHLRHLRGYMASPWGSELQLGKLHEGQTEPLAIDRLTKEKWYVTIRSPGFVRATRPIFIGDEVSELEFLLKPAKAQLQGRLIDSSTSKPIAGVSVSYEYDVKGDKSRMRYDRGAILTREDGRFVFDSAPGEDYATRLNFNHDGYFGVTKEFAADEPWNDDLGDIELTPYSWITGKLTDADGQPIAGRMIYVIPADLDHTDPKAVVSHVYGMQKATGQPGKVWRLTTDAEGRFSTFNNEAPWSPATPPMRAGKYRVVFGSGENDQQVVSIAVGEKSTLELQ